MAMDTLFMLSGLLLVYKTANNMTGSEYAYLYIAKLIRSLIIYVLIVLTITVIMSIIVI